MMNRYDDRTSSDALSVRKAPMFIKVMAPILASRLGARFLVLILDVAMRRFRST